MKSLLNHLSGAQRLLAAAAVVSLGLLSNAQADVVSYTAALDSQSESPPNPWQGTGVAQLDIDVVAHTMHLFVAFEGLYGTVTASHIHAATAVAGVGNVGVATTTPTFAGFPSGVTAGTYDNTLNMTQTTSYNAAYITANGGTVATAEIALSQAVAAGKAYLNIHTNFYPGGEIRGFFEPLVTPTESSTWGQVKSLYR